MREVIETTFPGIEEHVLCFSQREQQALLRAADILEEARMRVGPNTHIGGDLGSAEVRCREYGDAGEIYLYSQVVELKL